MLAIKTLNQFYSGSHILWDVNLEVPEGSCTCLMGRNGVGKTTTLKSVVGLVKLDSGSVKLDSTELAGQKPDQRARHRLPRGSDHLCHFLVG